MTGGRIPCLNPRCRRTAPAEKYADVEIVCGKCWKLLPKSVTDRYRRLNRVERKILRRLEKRVAQRSISAATISRLERQMADLKEKNWAAIRSYFLTPEKPEGLDAFLEEMNLK